MSMFIFAYRAPKDFQPGDPEVGAAWRSYLASLGPALHDAGNPIFNRGSLGETATESVLSGYSFINADDLESALVLAKGCPFVGVGGGVDVGELAPLPKLD